MLLGTCQALKKLKTDLVTLMVILCLEALQSSHPKVLSPELILPKTRVMSPDILSLTCCLKFHNAQKDSKNVAVNSDTH